MKRRAEEQGIGSRASFEVVDMLKMKLDDPLLSSVTKVKVDILDDAVRDLELAVALLSSPPLLSKCTRLTSFLHPLRISPPPSQSPPTSHRLRALSSPAGDGSDDTASACSGS
eukprot:748461-Hanusia_phi.AAC.2